MSRARDTVRAAGLTALGAFIVVMTIVDPLWACVPGAFAVWLIFRSARRGSR